MARKVQVLLVDDLDGTDLGTKGETVSFALDGQTYELDLSDKNAKSMRDAFGMYVQHARKATTSRSGRRGGHGSTGRTSADRNETQAARAWLVEHGHLKADSRGRIPSDKWELYRNRGQQTVPKPAPSLAETKGEVPPRADSNSTKPAKAAPKADQPVAV